MNEVIVAPEWAQVVEDRDGGIVWTNQKIVRAERRIHIAEHMLLSAVEGNGSPAVRFELLDEEGAAVPSLSDGRARGPVVGDLLRVSDANHRLVYRLCVICSPGGGVDSWLARWV